MSRKARKLCNTSFFHVIIQGLNKEYIFDEEDNIKEYFKLLMKNIENTEVQVIAYCIMNNHAHFLFFTNRIEKLSKIMQKTNTVYAKYYNSKNDRVGYVFRDRFLSKEIDSERYLAKCINYIHNNPVRANIVCNPIEYKYSSYNSFINGQNIKTLLRLTGVKFDIEQFKKNDISEYFIDIDKNKEEVIENAIVEFCNENNIKLHKILEERYILKQLVKKLKINYKIKYIEIMKKLEIPKGVMKRLK